MATLPPNPTWRDHAGQDANWRFQLHAMRYVLDLFTAARQTGKAAYQDRALFLIRDWTADNPRHSAPSTWSWNDHSTALRAVVLACAAELTPMTTWLRSALILHGQTLADPAFYRRQGNHALNQDIGLLEVAKVLNRSDWRKLAGERINTLILRSVDAEGVTNEQAIGYEDFNYRRYREAEARMLAVGLEPSAAFARVDLMPQFLAHATLPNGTYEMIGDTSAWPADRILGTVAEYAASQGASGPEPTATVKRYKAGYLFARSGWGDDRPPVEETFLSMKWGAAPIFHGHRDGLELTLASRGSRLLVDPGPYSYGGGAYRWFFKSRAAHNIVTVDGSTWSETATTRLLGYGESARFVDIRLQGAGDRGVVHTRRMTYSRALDYILVEDRLTSASLHTYRQLWHFVEDAKPFVGANGVRTQRAHGNVLIRQLAGSPEVRIVKGATSPIQGWISYKGGQKLAAPVEEAILRGRSVRYLTLIVPAEGRPGATVSDLELTSSGYAVTIRIGTRSERVTVSGSTVKLVELP
jgi:Heparinase II/III-like protein/Heparinase II/III N-terminus